MHSLKYGFHAGLARARSDYKGARPGEHIGIAAVRFGQGDCGTSFFTAEPVTNAPRMHFELRFNAHNWDPHELLPTLRLLMDSIDITLLSLKRPSDWRSRRFYG